MNHSIAIAVAEDRRQFCPCGATTEHPPGLCRKCRARMTWRRRNAQPRRRTARRRLGRRARDRARALASSASTFRATEEEADL